MAIDCSICFEDFSKNTDSDVVVTKCGHMYHLDCLNEWMKQSITCPECRLVTRRNSWRKIYLNLSDSSVIETILNAKNALEKENQLLKEQLDAKECLMEHLKKHLAEAQEKMKKIEANKQLLAANTNKNRIQMRNITSNALKLNRSKLYAHIESKVAQAWK